MDRDRTKLDELYPKPKTSEQRLNDQKASNGLRAKRTPKHVIASTSLRMYSIWIVLGLTVQVLSGALQGNIISGVFLCFLLGLVWVGYALWMMALISDTFSKLGFSANLFFFAYYISFPMLGFMTYTLSLPVGPWVPFVALTGIHFALSFVLTRDLYKLHRS